MSEDHNASKWPVHHLEMCEPKKSGGPPRIPVAKRIADGTIIDAETGCYIWAKYLLPNGYGTIGIRYTKIRVHRAAYELVHGPIPDGLVIDHLCRNRACCNPDHMEVVTPAENTRRGNSPSAISARTGLCQKGHVMDEDNTIISGSKRSRYCRTCAKAHRKALKSSKQQQMESL